MPDFEISWGAAPRQWELGDGDVHVWASELDRTPGELLALAAALDSSERDRAGRFLLERDRNRFICGRGLLRAILALICISSRRN